MLHSSIVALTLASTAASFDRLTMASDADRQMRDSEPAEREPTPGLDSWSFLDGQQRRDRERQAVAVGPQGSLSFIEGLEAAHKQRIAELTRPQREPAPASWLSSFTQTFSRSKSEDEDENAATGGAERDGGAPNDHWRDCATSQMENKAITEDAKYGDCACYRGEVRFGSEAQGIWTQPVEMGENQNVQCSVDGLQKLRVSMPTHTGSERPRQCQCIERELRLEAIACTPESDPGCATKPKAAEALLEREDPDPYANAGSDIAANSKAVGLYPNTQTEVCMYVPAAASLLDLQATTSSLAQTAWESKADGEAHSMNQHQMLKELATEIQLETCDTESPSQIWTYLESTGQIRHAGTGKCMGVYFDHRAGNGEPLLKAHDCNQNAETQYLIQRWELDGYTGDNFETGKGVIRLAYGAHSGHPLCLDVINTDKMELRSCSGSSTQWLLRSDNGPHKFNKCTPQAAEEGMCACGGEIRFGDGEGGQFTDGVAVPNLLDFSGEVQCDLSILRQIAIRDPVYVEDIKDGKARSCQCRGKKGLDGSTAADELPIPMIAGGVVGALVLAGVVYLVVEARKRNAWAAEWEEEEYEEEGYEEYEE